MDYFKVEERVKPPKSIECSEFLFAHPGSFKGRPVQSIQDKVKTLLRQRKRVNNRSTEPVPSSNSKEKNNCI